VRLRQAAGQTPTPEAAKKQGGAYALEAASNSPSISLEFPAVRKALRSLSRGNVGGRSTMVYQPGHIV
jgi:hypothetical protein